MWLGTLRRIRRGRPLFTACLRAWAVCLAAVLLSCGGGSPGQSTPDAPDVEVRSPDVPVETVETDDADAVGAVCGDGLCEATRGEGPGSCPVDCCACGDGDCVPDECGEWWEAGKGTCATDCAECGDDACDPGEGPILCAADCCGTCGDEICKGGLCGETWSVCPGDCAGAECGNGICEPGENPVDCAGDCEPYQCGNGTCEPGEGPDACPDDCASTCGDCACEGGESYGTCPVDCGYCGDGYCIADCSYHVETPNTCAADCCIADCEGSECGDDGCGEPCGVCSDGTVCTADGVCVGCTPDCGGVVCGPDGCGGSCGECPDDQFCLADGSCFCIPDCVGKTCGDDGCGGDCGACEVEHVCEDGACICIPDCSGKDCGDDGCEGDCGACPIGQCIGGVCSCTPDCEDKECGADGCGGDCGQCPGTGTCLADGSCFCIPDCAGKVCGGNGCGGTCGTCAPSTACVDGACQCVPDCADKACGPDGCGDTCGQCPDDGVCLADGKCLCFQDCEGKVCGDDGCGGSCGLCAFGWTCQLGTCLEADTTWCYDDNEIEWDGCNFTEIAEFRVNSTIPYDQQGAVVTTLPGDRYVVVWTSEAQDGDQGGIFGQRFFVDGSENGEEFQVNATWEGHQAGPAVAAFPDGRFLVVWHHHEPDVGLDRIVARSMSASGGDDGEEIIVFTGEEGPLCCPDAAVFADSRFVVTWDVSGADGDGWGVAGQRYLADGVTTDGGVFLANFTTEGDQRSPPVATAEDGTSVVFYQVALPDSDAEIYGHTFHADGQPFVNEFVVSGWYEGARESPSVATVDANPPMYVAAWATCPSLLGDVPDGDGCGIYAQLATFNGAIGGVVPVNTWWEDDQAYPTVAPLSENGFVVVWQSGWQDGSQSSIYGQRFISIGWEEGEEFKVNGNKVDTQTRPDVAAFSDQSFVVVWTSTSIGDDGKDVFAQRFDPEGKKEFH